VEVSNLTRMYASIPGATDTGIAVTMSGEAISTLVIRNGASPSFFSAKSCSNTAPVSAFPN